MEQVGAAVDEHCRHGCQSSYAHAPAPPFAVREIHRPVAPQSTLQELISKSKVQKPVRDAGEALRGGTVPLAPGGGVCWLPPLGMCLCTVYMPSYLLCLCQVRAVSPKRQRAVTTPAQPRSQPRRACTDATLQAIASSQVCMSMQTAHHAPLLVLHGDACCLEHPHKLSCQSRQGIHV